MGMWVCFGVCVCPRIYVGVCVCTSILTSEKYICFEGEQHGARILVAHETNNSKHAKGDIWTRLVVSAVIGGTGGEQQLQSSSIRDLGVIYDQHLNMGQHVHSVGRTRYHRIQYKILSHTYRAIHHQSPVYPNDLLSVYRPIRSLQSDHPSC